MLFNLQTALMKIPMLSPAGRQRWRTSAEVGEGRRHPVIVLMLPEAILSARRRAENVNSKG
jgi:hypothetical protein